VNASEHTRDEYETIKTGYNDLATKAQDAATALQEVEQLCSRLQQEIDRAPETLETIKHRLAETQQLERELSTDGFRTEVSTQLTNAQTLLASAEQLITERKFGLAIGKLEDAEETLEAVENHLQSLRRTRAALTERHSQLLAQVEEVASALQDAESVLGRMFNRYDSSCWEDVQNGLVTVTSELTAARTDLEQATEHFSMERQEWQGSEQLLNTAERRIRGCRKPCTAVSTRSQELQQFAANASDILDGIRTSVTTTSSSMNGLRGDHGDRKHQLGRVQHEIGDLQTSLGSAKPNYLAAMARVETLRSTIASIDQGARDEDQRIRTAERKRREAEEAAARRRREEEAAAARRRSSLNSSGSS
jgi:chromosome segregation ATPase